jgi:hypothetical protein
MATYRMTSTHKDAQGTWQYQVTKTDQYRQEVIFNSIDYIKGTKWCEENIKDDDIYQEANGNHLNHSVTGKQLKESREKLRNK